MFKNFFSRFRDAGECDRLFAAASDDHAAAWDLVQRLLVIRPEGRLDAAAVREHPFFAAPVEYWARVHAGELEPPAEFRQQHQQISSDAPEEPEPEEK